MIYIVIPVFNRLKYTSACLQSLFNQHFEQYKVLLIDHGSTDGTSEYVSANFPDVDIIAGDDSMWWTAATNLGVQKALSLSTDSDDMVLTLNNDLVVEPDYLQQLVNAYKQNKPCLVGSVSLYINNTDKIEFAGLKWNNINAKYKINEIRRLPYTQVRSQYEFLETDLLSGRGTLIPIKAFIDLGIYDNANFPHYAADEDFALRCKRAGYRLIMSVKGVVKSHVEDTGLNFTFQKIKFKDFTKSLSSIRSANNLQIRYRWAKKNTPLPYIYYLFDAGRIFGSYFKSMLKK